MASLTISMTTTGGTINKTLAIPDADIPKLVAAYTALLVADGHPAPTTADVFNAMVASWVADTVGFVRQSSISAATTTAVNSVTPISVA